MVQGSRYAAHAPDASGRVRYTRAEHAIWAELYARQQAAIRGKACDEFVQGLDLLRLPPHRVPQIAEVSAALRRHTGWEVAPVPALIPLADFFALLAQRRFPAATFVRSRRELDYLREPDIFHELFGHAPLLTNPYFADFTQAYGRLGLAAGGAEREFLARLYWFTAEFGLVGRPGEAPRIYGGGILSSIGETAYAWASPLPRRRRFGVLQALRTPYRIDIMQPLYYVIEDLRELCEVARTDLMAQVARARKLGLFAPLYEPAAPPAPSARRHAA
ncbi:MAG: phenylalanine 4-monooxygenase [Nevskia sp.]|nr:phenylalanine 4-monooxygenase [Nevskia sp.]